MVPERKETWIAAIVFLVVLALFGLLAVPNYVGRGPGKVNAIINNLRQLDGAMQQWANVHGYTNAMTVTREDIAPYVKDGWIKPVAGEQYILKNFPDSPEARLIRKVERHLKGTIIRFRTNADIEIVPPN